MTDPRQQSVASAARTLFDAALDADPNERRRLLDAASDDVAREAAGLLDAWHRSSGFLETGCAARRVGPWQVLGSLGVGGMGDVSLVRRGEDFEQIGALKRVRADLVTPEVLARFRVERSALARLDHPNIARLIDGGETTDGEPYLVMEFVDGEPIDRWCDDRRLDVAGRIRLILPVMEALRSAHARLVVHRDLKPSNMLVSMDGTPKLLDFGIARLLDPDGGSSPTLPAMTPRYASPEQLLAEPVTTSTDVYGIGVLVYELLTGVHPHGDADASVAEIQETILRRPPARASDALRGRTDSAAIAAARGTTAPRLSATLHGDLDIVLATALRKEPERRYATVDAFADDLRRYLEARPVTAHADSWQYRASRFIRRNRVASAAAFLLAAGAIVTSSLSVAA
ncbi:MAG: serine/threonine-protein kinase [Phycisphaerae bacterium]|nr:serine/threonine-protein kinase [Phycisphaerae bacterium]